MGNSFWMTVAGLVLSALGLIQGEERSRLRRLRRLERSAAIMHRMITGCRLQRNERFTDTELLHIFWGSRPAAEVRAQLLAPDETGPYARILYWCWLYWEQRGSDEDMVAAA